jgi:hypothetical protein
MPQHRAPATRHVGATILRLRRFESLDSYIAKPHYRRSLIFVSAGSLTRFGGIFTVSQKPPFMRDQPMVSTGDFNGNAGLWCARRAVALVVISIGWRHLSSHKVHFRPIGAFQTEHKR